MFAVLSQANRKIKNMPRTAPTFSDSPAGQDTLSYSMVDSSGDRKAVSFDVLSAATSLQIEDFIAKEALSTNSNIYAIRLTRAFNSPAKASDAVDASQNSVHDAIVVHAKNALNSSFRFWIPAPIRDLFSGATDNPDAADPTLVNVITAFELITGSSGITARYNERAEKNEATSL